MRLALSQAVGSALWLLVIGVALGRGGIPERIVALALLTNLIAVEAFEVVRRDVLWVAFWADLAVFLSIVATALRFRRRWLLWATGAAFASVLGHVPRMMDSEIRNLGYAYLIAGLGYALLATLLWGALSGSRIIHDDDGR